MTDQIDQPTAPTPAPPEVDTVPETDSIGPTVEVVETVDEGPTDPGPEELPA